MAGPLPTHFRWLWYLVGLAGMVLSVIGILAILGSAADTGILVPVVVGGAIAIGYAIVRFRRSLDAAVAAAPSRQAGATPATVTDPDVTTQIPAADGPVAEPTARKPPDTPTRTSRR
jgi:hypothetical protein